MYKTMLCYCFRCTKNTKSKNPRLIKKMDGKRRLSSNYVISGSKKSIFIKEKEGREFKNLDLLKREKLEPY